MKYKVVLIIYRVIFISFTFWHSLAEMILFYKFAHAKYDSESIRVILFETAVIVLMTAGDFLIFNLMRRKTDDRKLKTRGRFYVLIYFSTIPLLMPHSLDNCLTDNPFE